MIYAYLHMQCIWNTEEKCTRQKTQEWERNHFKYLQSGKKSLAVLDNIGEWCHAFFHLVRSLLIVTQVCLEWKYIITDLKVVWIIYLLDIIGRIVSHAKLALLIWNKFLLLTRILFSGLTYPLKTVFFFALLLQFVFL